MKQFFKIICTLICAYPINAQITDPMITKWMFNTTNQSYTGTQGTFLVDVQEVYYTTSKVYVKTYGLPSYYTDSNTTLFDAKGSNKTFVFPRTQTVANTSTRTYLRDANSIGLFIDGSPIFAPTDSKSYNSAGIWHQLAYKFEGLDFDTTYGHGTPQNVYHHHVAVNNSTLNSLTDSSVHSPLIGYAFDGYPIYGPYGYTNTNGTGAIKRMTTSWQLRNITSRTTLPDGSTASSSGPSIGNNPPTSYPLGNYFEDYSYIEGSGDLDQFNGRFCITPEYPSGTYCYFTTIDASLLPEFPYFIGDYYYGVIQTGNTGPTGGNNSIPNSATYFDPATLGLENNVFENLLLNIYPNPVINSLTIENQDHQKYTLNLYDGKGVALESIEIYSDRLTIDFSKYESGTYIIQFINKENGNGYVKKIIKN